MAADARTELARMEAEEAKARKAAEDLISNNAAKKKELLQALREQDLADVRNKCAMHGFTATELRGFLKGKGPTKRSADGAVKAPTPRRKKAKTS